VSQALPQPPPEASLSGRTLGGRYRLGEVVAEGGMATVYRATPIEGGPTVAVKVMHPYLTRERNFAQRFRREAVIAGRLTHAGVVRVLDYGADGGLFYLVMDLLSGADLFDVLRRHQRLDPAVARRVLIEVCEALVEPHSQGIVHRDLKPENVFLARGDGGVLTVKVLDFGVAKMMLPEPAGEGDSDPVLTAMGTLLGTPEYISPEMCRGEGVGPSADLYSCGVLLYALLTGRPPFVTERPIDVTVKHLFEAPRPPSEHVPGLDPALDAVILRALAKTPEERQPSARALADALRALGPTAPLSATLLGDSAWTAPSVPRHAPDSPTLAHAATVAMSAFVEQAAPPSPLPVAGMPALLETPAAVAPPFALAPVPPSASPRAPTPAVRWAVAVAVLLATFAAGVLVGRWSMRGRQGHSHALRDGQAQRPGVTGHE